MGVPGLRFLTFSRPLSLSEVEIKTMDGSLSTWSFFSPLVGIERACKVRTHNLVCSILRSFHAQSSRKSRQAF